MSVGGGLTYVVERNYMITCTDLSSTSLWVNYTAWLVTFKGKGKKEEANLYSAFIEVPYTQGIRYGSHSATCKLHSTCLYLISIHQMTHPKLRLRTSNCSLLLIYLPPKGWKAELAWVAGYVTRQFTCPKAITHPSTNRAWCRATALIETNTLPLHQTANRTAHHKLEDHSPEHIFLNSWAITSSTQMGYQSCNDNLDHSKLKIDCA